MLLKKLVTNTGEDGGMDATFALTQVQVAALLNFAIAYLLQEGMAEVQEVTQEEIDNETQKSFLADVETDKLFQA